MKKYVSLCLFTNAFLLICFAAYFFLIPAGIIINDINSPKFRNGETSPFVIRLHKKLSKDYALWAHQRVTSGRATELDVEDISGTEWPMFSSVFYLWSTEALQKAWDKDPSISSIQPKTYASDAIKAAAALISDPNNAAWVKKHWGKNYLHRENIFYRMLLISGLTSYQKLTGDQKYQALLKDQVTSLAKEIDASPYGLLYDYPGQCYPIDVLPAIAAIKRGGTLLGIDYSDFVKRAVRAFEGTRLDPQTNLPSYLADPKSGEGIGPARGTAISYMLIWKPELWPDLTQKWYLIYEKHFWQDGIVFTGVREFSYNTNISTFLFDVDAGPVLFGYGTAASAFGIGATRVNGRFDQAYPLMAQALTYSWPLPNNSLLLPRFLSNWSDAPYVGETGLLFAFTREVISDKKVSVTDNLPLSVYLGILIYIGVGLTLIIKAILSLRKYRNLPPEKIEAVTYTQIIVWLLLTAFGIWLIAYNHIFGGAVLLVLAQFLPGFKKRTPVYV